MKILVFNCGSSTLKFKVIELNDENSRPGEERSLVSGSVERIGAQGRLRIFIPDRENYSGLAATADHGEAVRHVLQWLREREIPGPAGPEAVGHRVVHGGYFFSEPAPINDEVMAGIEASGRLAPLHNLPALSAILAARAALGTAVPQVAVFDTAFHRTLPPKAANYAIPAVLADKHKIYRYGFHGLAHRSMSERYAAITQRPPEQMKIITLQLGNGSSAAAVDGGRSVDTSMGFTPLEGLMMGTRSGDMDPSIVSFLARQEKTDVQEVERWLNTGSGLLGVSGCSHDMRELLEAEAAGNTRASLAVEMFCYRIRKYIGAYLAALNGAEAVVFGGGIGENSPQIRERICCGMEWCGVSIDRQLNAGAVGVVSPIHAGNSRIYVYVITVDEEAVIARDTFSCLRSR